LTLSHLEKLYKSQSQLYSNQQLRDRLPDGGEKIKEKMKMIQKCIEEKRKLENKKIDMVSDVLGEMKISGKEEEEEEKITVTNSSSSAAAAAASTTAATSIPFSSSSSSTSSLSLPPKTPLEQRLSAISSYSLHRHLSSLLSCPTDPSSVGLIRRRQATPVIEQREAEWLLKEQFRKAVEISGSSYNTISSMNLNDSTINSINNSSGFTGMGSYRSTETSELVEEDEEDEEEDEEEDGKRRNRKGRGRKTGIVGTNDEVESDSNEDGEDGDEDDKRKRKKKTKKKGRTTEEEEEEEEEQEEEDEMTTNPDEVD